MHTNETLHVNPSLNAPTAIHYHLAVPAPEQHLFHVELRLSSELDVLHFSMPDWIPGSYLIRDYARHIVTLEASVSGEPVALEKQSKSRWRLANARGDVCLRYTVYAFDQSVRGAFVDHTRWFANGVCVFLSCEEATCVPHRVQVEPAALSADWSLVTTLDSNHADTAVAQVFCAENYAQLIDNPLMAGKLTRYDFDVYGVTHEVVVSGRVQLDGKRIARDLKAVCECHVQLFGEPPPMPRYVFMVLAGGERAGGLEHCNCTVLSVPRTQLQGAPDSEDYTEFLSLASHEYFHAWLVKRIRPRALAEASLDREAYTQMLWVFEGITSYYDELALVRAGVLSAAQYLERLAKLLTRVQRGSGRGKQSLAESSFDAWTRFYKQDENAANAIVSYYAKGALVAMCLDLSLRQRSDGVLSLDTVMRKLWQGVSDGSTDSLAEGDFEALVQAIAPEDMQPFFDQAVRGTEEVPYDHYLAAQGVSMRWRASDAPLAWTGFSLRPGTATVAVVHEASPAQRAGLSPNDELCAWQGLRFEASVNEAEGEVGEAVIVHVFRDNELLELTLRRAEPPADVCILESKAGFEDRRDQWLLGHA